MVEKMKKYSFLVYYRTCDEFLESIRDAGVVHVVEKQKGVPDDATGLRGQLASADVLKNTVRSLRRRLDTLKDVQPKPVDPSVDGMKALAEYERMKAHDEQLRAGQQTLQKEIDSMAAWGDFDLNILDKLEQAGRQMKFYSCREREFDPEWADKFDAVEVKRIGAIVYFVTLTPVGCESEPDAEKMRLADRPLGALQAALRENRAQMEDTGRQLDALAVEHLHNLKETQRQLLESIDLNRVRLHTEKKADEKLVLLEGWVPEAKEPELKAALEKQDACYTCETPAATDPSVPILLKNNWFTRLFEPIGELYDFPNYHELDLTPFFAPFYMLFFGLCLGDAGYGLLLLVAALVARPRMKPSMKPVITLVAILGAATMICGVVAGTFFGIPLLDMQWPWLTSFKRFMLNSDSMFNLALILGGVQIIFAMFVKAFGQIRRYGFAHSLDTWGWLTLILGGGGLYLAFGETALSHHTARYLCYAVMGVSAMLIFIFNTPGRNPLINVGAGLWNTYNMVTGLLGDLLSYIRLFALGICGGVMGFVFNDLAMQMSGDIPVVSQIVMLVILLAGHSLNIFMSGLGAFVHPMRLTFVEFYKNSGFEGGGKKYRPLKRIEI
jgi:V/A-type H+-transporting ATPase subunit I